MRAGSADERAGWLASLLRVSIGAPLRTIAFWLVITAAAATGVLFLQVETSTDSVLSREDPAWQYYQESTARFGGDEVVVAAVHGIDPFDETALREVGRITRELEESPLFRRVDSIASVAVVNATPDGSLALDPALQWFEAGDPIDSAAVRRALEGDRIAPRLLVSEDGRTFSITGLMEELGAERDAQAVAAMRKALRNTPAEVSGGPVFRAAMNRILIDDLVVFIPVSTVFIFGLCFATFRSVAAAMVPLATGSLASVIVVGLMGFSGVPLTVSTVILPTVLLALACAYVMHLLWAASESSASDGDLVDALLPLARPIALSGLTTALGFVAMSLVRIDVIRHVGIFGAVGALLLVFLSLSFAPAMLQRTHSQRRESTDRAGRGAGSAISRSAERWALRMASLPRWPVLIGWFAIAAALASGLTRLEIETDVVLWFPEGTPIRDDYAAIRESLSGISPMNVVIEADADRSGDSRVTDPAVMQRIAELSDALEAMPEVGRSLAITDPVLQLHRGFTGDPDAPLPPTQQANEQYLLLLESVEALHDLLTSDHRAASISLRVDNNGSDDLLRVAAAAESWWGEHGTPGFHARTTGIMHEYARSETEIQNGQLRGLAFALAAVTAVLLAVFRSPRLAALGLVPNLVPLLAAFGGMGLASIALDAGTVLLGSLALGIAVDDTIHLLTAVHDGHRDGLDRSTAVQDAMRRVLPPILLSTIAVGIGFGILGLSSFVLTRNLGLVTAVIMFVCLAADATLLPALLRPSPGKSAAASATT